MDMDHQAECEEIIARLREDGSTGLDLDRKADQYRREANWEKAVEYADRSIRLCLDTGDRHAVGFGLLRKGAIYHAQGKLQEAVSFYEASLEAFVNDRYNRAVTHFALGIVHHGLANWRETLKNYQFSMEILRGLDDLLYSVVEERWRQAVDLSGGEAGATEEGERGEEEEEEERTEVEEEEKEDQVEGTALPQREEGGQALRETALGREGETEAIEEVSPVVPRIALAMVAGGLIGGSMGLIAMSVAGHIGFNVYLSFLVTFPVATLLLTIYVLGKTRLPHSVEFGRVAVVERSGQPRIVEAGQDVLWIPFLDRMRALVPIWEFSYACPQRRISVSPEDQVEVGVHVCYRVEHPVRATYHFCRSKRKSDGRATDQKALLLEEEVKRMWERQLLSDILPSLKRVMWGVTEENLAKNRESIETHIREELNRRTREWGISVTEVLLETRTEKGGP